MNIREQSLADLQSQFLEFGGSLDAEQGEEDLEVANTLHLHPSITMDDVVEGLRWGGGGEGEGAMEGKRGKQRERGGAREGERERE